MEMFKTLLFLAEIVVGVFIGQTQGVSVSGLVQQSAHRIALGIVLGLRPSYAYPFYSGHNTYPNCQFTTPTGTYQNNHGSNYPQGNMPESSYTLCCVLDLYSDKGTYTGIVEYCYTNGNFGPVNCGSSYVTPICSGGSYTTSCVGTTLVLTAVQIGNAGASCTPTSSNNDPEPYPDCLNHPICSPTKSPSDLPTTAPSRAPSHTPSHSPTKSPYAPSHAPSLPTTISPSSISMNNNSPSVDVIIIGSLAGSIFMIVAGIATFCVFKKLHSVQKRNGVGNEVTSHGHEEIPNIPFAVPMTTLSMHNENSLQISLYHALHPMNDSFHVPEKGLVANEA